MKTLALLQSKVVAVQREVVLDLAEIRDANNPEKFVVIPPPKKGKLDTVCFRDGSLIRRTVSTVNQMFPHEVIQKFEPGSDKPKYKLSDPANTCCL